jgi:hypothetical protein
MSYSHRKHTGFSRAGTCYHKRGAFGIQHCFFLGGIQSFEVVLHNIFCFLRYKNNKVKMRMFKIGDKKLDVNKEIL